jgi:hypothetical protein
MIIKVLSICLFLTSVCSFRIQREKLQPLVPSETYTHRYNADEDNLDSYVLFTKFLNDKEILIEVHCKTRGWVGLGFGVNGGMEGADIVIGWVDSSGIAHIKDTFASGFSTPVIDEIQNVELLSAIEIDDYTIIKFKRKLNTCDEKQDVEIKSETNYLLFAWHDNDPNLENVNWIAKHKKNNRFSRVTMLFDYISDNIIVDHNSSSDFSRELYIKDVSNDSF